jgi:hypothetical protein
LMIFGTCTRMICGFWNSSESDGAGSRDSRMRSDLRPRNQVHTNLQMEIQE